MNYVIFVCICLGVCSMFTCSTTKITSISKRHPQNWPLYHIFLSLCLVAFCLFLLPHTILHSSTFCFYSFIYSYFLTSFLVSWFLHMFLFVRCKTKNDQIVENIHLFLNHLNVIFVKMLKLNTIWQKIFENLRICISKLACTTSKWEGRLSPRTEK